MIYCYALDGGVIITNLFKFYVKLQATGLDPTPFTPVKEAPDYFTNEEQDGDYMNVEESISRLVLDDDVDDIENERDRFIKASHKSLMPPQVCMIK